MIESWQRCRAELNHYQLRNRFLTALMALISRVTGLATVGEDFGPDSGRLSGWPRLATELGELLEDFEKAMTPAVFLDRPPLNRLDRDWRESARPCIHALWLARYPVGEWLAAAHAALAEADTVYRHLFPVDAPPGLTESGLRELHDRCIELSDSVSRLPSRIPLI